MWNARQVEQNTSLHESQLSAWASQTWASQSQHLCVASWPQGYPVTSSTLATSTISHCISGTPDETVILLASALIWKRHDWSHFAHRKPGPESNGCIQERSDGNPLTRSTFFSLHQSNDLQSGEKLLCHKFDRIDSDRGLVGTIQIAPATSHDQAEAAFALLEKATAAFGFSPIFVPHPSSA